MAFKKLACCLLLLSPLFGMVDDSCCVDRGSLGLFLEGRALGWQLGQDYLDYAIETGSTSTTSFVGPALFPEFNWKAAFRVGGGYISSCNRWISDAQWTHFDQKATSTTDILSSSSKVFERASSTASSGQFRIFFDLIDVNLRRSFCPSMCLTLSPYIGVRGLVLKEKFNIIYNNIDSSATNATYEAKANFNGVGGRAGLGTAWNFLRRAGQWSLVGDGSCSVIQGVMLRGLNSVDLSNNDDDVWSYHENRATTKLVLEVSAGLEWKCLLNNCMFGCGPFPLILSLTYEGLYLPNIFAAPQTAGAFNVKGDLGFGGVTLGGRLGF